MADRTGPGGQAIWDVQFRYCWGWAFPVLVTEASDRSATTALDLHIEWYETSPVHHSTRPRGWRRPRSGQTEE